MKRRLHRYLDAVPLYGYWRRTARNLRQAVGPFGPGHFYSPIPSPQDVELAIAEAGRDQAPGGDGIDLHEAAQLDLLVRLAEHNRDQRSRRGRSRECGSTSTTACSRTPTRWCCTA